MKFLKTINENIFDDNEKEKILISFSKSLSKSEWSFANVAYKSSNSWTLKTVIDMSAILSEYKYK